MKLVRFWVIMALSLITFLSYPMEFTKQFVTVALDFATRHKIALAATATVGAAALATQKIYAESLHWNWKNINPELAPTAQRTGQMIYHPTAPIETIGHYFANRHVTLQKEPTLNKWLWGAGTSAYQVESDCTNSQWQLFIGKPLDGKEIASPGEGCKAQENEDIDIENMKALGLNSYRFSVEWSKIFPEKDVINHQELIRYKNFCRKLKENSIEPVITLYHYSEPIWFHEMGSFEKEENIQHFVTFCATVFKELHEDVYLWLTFNAPESVALTGWMTGDKPPAKKNMQLAVEVLDNVLEAHVRVYQTFKSMPGGQKSKVGILKNILQLDPWNVLNPLDHIACKIGNHLQNDSVYKFLTTGIFSVYVPFKASHERTNEYLAQGGKCLDFIGLNYYCHNYIRNFKPIREPNPAIEIPAANKRYTIYGEGLYRAITEISDAVAKPLAIPIYITENGIGTDNDEHRTLHNQRYLYALAKAISEGHDVRGYIHWSLIDNYEWGQYKSHYGLYHVDREKPDLPRTLKKGSHYYQKVVQATFESPEVGLDEEPILATE